LGKGDTVVEQLSRSARIADHEVGLTFVELKQIDSEAVAGPLGDASGVFAIGYRPAAGALVAIGHGSVVLGGTLPEGIPQRRGEPQTMVGVGQGPGKIAESGECDAGVAGSSGLLGGVS